MHPPHNIFGAPSQRPPIARCEAWASYGYNGMPQRSWKSTSGGLLARYLYGLGGELLFERNTTGAARSEKSYVWLGPLLRARRT